MQGDIDPDKYCSYFFEEPDPRAGTQCEGMHIKDSPYCMGHSERKAEIAEARSKQAMQVRALQEKLTGSHHNTKTMRGVQDLTELIINGIIQGTMKKDKAAPLGVFLPFAWKMATKLEQTEGTSKIRIDLTEKTQSMTIQMSDEEMDRYLSGNEQLKIEMLEDMKAKGKIKMKKRKDGDSNIIDIKPGDVEPVDVKTDATTIAKISKGTSLPVDRKQALKLFGKNMGDKTVKQKEPDPTGFDHLFEKDKKHRPTGLPEEAFHKWKGKYEDAGNGTAKLWFTCQQCGERAPNTTKDTCKPGGKDETE